MERDWGRRAQRYARPSATAMARAGRPVVLASAGASARCAAAERNSMPVGREGVQEREYPPASRITTAMQTVSLSACAGRKRKVQKQVR